MSQPQPPGLPGGSSSQTGCPLWQGLAFGRVGRGEPGQGSSLASVLVNQGVSKTNPPAEVRAHLLPFPGVQAFGAILNLVPLAESVVKLNAVCMECFREAAYTKRLGMEKEVTAARLLRGCGAAWRGCARSVQAPLCPPGQVEVIGGADKYHAVCRLCYFQKALGQLGLPAGQDDKEDKENCLALGKPGEAKPGEAASARKPLAPHQILQCSPAN